MAFTYLEDASQSVWTNSVEVGKYFRQAGQRYVLDGPNARQSWAIAFERAAARDLEGHERLQRRALLHKVAASELGARVADRPCCRFCIDNRGPDCEDILLGRTASPAGRICGKLRCGIICNRATQPAAAAK